MIIKDLTDFLETLAPIALQENYDNCGLIVGDENSSITGVLFTLDCTEEVIDEAIALKLNVIVAHHPIVFSGLKKLNGKTYVERTVIKAIQNNIAIYAAHTNFDNLKSGVNAMFSEKLNLKNLKILAPKLGTLKKIVTFCPTSAADTISQSLANAGAGAIENYTNCSFSTNGIGAFKANSNAKPYVGEIGTLHHENETRLEMIFPFYNEKNILKALINSHPYESVAYDIISLDNKNPDVGSGMIGELESPLDELDFLKLLKSTFDVGTIKHTHLLNKKIKKVAVCGGSGSFLLQNAIAQQADVYVSSDFKYHEFFDADNKILIADIGHFESEQFTPQLFYNHIIKKFSTFAAHLSKVSTNPIKYF